ncbi:MAG TPA: hypothetical protein VFV75_20355 [Candidatus Polarisedimenticolaceae bacterium]|nr:hypothetical protein [Candidatus Polarisedimenticolaceae bacterium]
MTRALDALERALEAVRADARCEVFQRRTRRISLEIEQGRVRVRHGVEEGTAVRLHRGDALRFGAASGLGVEAVREAIALASSMPATRLADGEPPWAEGGELRDVEDAIELPTREAMEQWLREAGEARTSLDAAVGVEALGTGDGLRACRVRGLVWARRHEGTRVRSAVARRLDRLDPEDWEEPAVVERPGLAAGFSVGVIALLPAAAGALAPALVAAVAVGSAVGPGWICEDHPGESNAPGGGVFDDTGFPAGRLQLADGHRVLALPRGPGRRRRHSFREPPTERAANLSFSRSGAWSGSGLLARAARIHAVGAEWSVVLDAALAQEGHPSSAWRPWLVVGPPEAWVLRCEAMVRPIRRTPEGVRSGTLVFRGHGLSAVPL